MQNKLINDIYLALVKQSFKRVLSLKIMIQVLLSGKNSTQEYDGKKNKKNPEHNSVLT